MMDGLPELARRLAELDADPNNLQWASGPGTDFVYAICSAPLIEGDREARDDGPCADIAHFISVVERITSSGITNTILTSDNHDLPCVSAAAADALVKNCRLLARLGDAVPEIVTGPLRFNLQHWVGTRKTSGRPKSELTLGESHFIGVSDADPMKASTKPFYVGLFTSTGVLGTYGMWRTYLDLNEYSSLHPRPWHTWAVEPHPNAVVQEIASASQWVELVLSHPRRERGWLFPDWNSVARQCDGVHMTLRAIAATQGLYFPTEQGLIAAPYWDVESTFWLRWCFDSVKLVETVT
jgi:hypothetical protein